VLLFLEKLEWPEWGKNSRKLARLFVGGAGKYRYLIRHLTMHCRESTSTSCLWLTSPFSFKFSSRFPSTTYDRLHPFLKLAFDVAGCSKDKESQPVKYCCSCRTARTLPRRLSLPLLGKGRWQPHQSSGNVFRPLAAITSLDICDLQG
jgi:hypothetical protein